MLSEKILRKPVFVDIDSTFNMDINSLETEIKRTLNEGKLTPKGIIPVDLFGRSANYDKILPIAEKYDLFVFNSLHGDFQPPPPPHEALSCSVGRSVGIRPWFMTY